MRDFGDWFTDTTRELNKTHSISNEKPTKEENKEDVATYTGSPHEWPYLPEIDANETYNLTIAYGEIIEIVTVTDDASTPTLTVDVEAQPTIQDTGAVPDVLEYRTQKKAHNTRKYTG